MRTNCARARCAMRIALSALLLSAGLIVGIWDIYVTARDEPEHTVSATMYDWATRWPVLPFVLGIIVGHLFWPHFPRQINPAPVVPSTLRAE